MHEPSSGLGLGLEGKRRREFYLEGCGVGGQMTLMVHQSYVYRVIETTLGLRRTDRYGSLQHLGIFNPPWPTQPGHPSVYRHCEYWYVTSTARQETASYV